MLSPKAKFIDLDLEHWKRLSELAYPLQRPRRLYLLHANGQPQRLWHSEQGDLAIPNGKVDDAKVWAQRLKSEHAQVDEVWVIEPDAFRKAMAKAQKDSLPQQDLDEYLLTEHETRSAAPGCAIEPAGDLIWHGLPLRRSRRFIEAMLPDTCAYVLAVFDGDKLWASLIAVFENKKIVTVTTTAALDPDDLKDVVGRDQHPFLIASVANTFKKPTFGWFVEKADFEAYMKAVTVEAKDEVFQTAIMQKRATFDFNILIDRHITPLAPMDPGTAAIQGQNREANPRTKTPDPGDPGPSAF